MMIMLALVGSSWGADAVGKAQKARPAGNAATAAAQQPIHNEYRGVRLGMIAEEVRATLGEPALKADDQDYYMVSDGETAQIAYDAQHKVKTISVDYLGGVGAPDPKSVVGGDLAVSPKGLYKLVRYEGLGFWVSFNRTAGPVIVVTITIQKI